MLSLRHSGGTRKRNCGRRIAFRLVVGLSIANMGSLEGIGFMLQLNRLAIAVTVIAMSFVVTSSAKAQGLIFNLPEDGTAVEYEGTLIQATGPDDQEPLSWTCELSIKSVGSEDAEYEGKVQPCRWIEIKTLTGKAGAAGIDPGPVGARIYKVLVPESKINGEPVDADNIPNDMLPIVRGFRRFGEEAVKKIKTPSLEINPTITLLRNYDKPEVIATNSQPEVIQQGPPITAKHLKGKLVMERAESRSTNEGEYWVSKDVPFGLARWIVSVTREEKESTAPRSDFHVVNIVSVDMKLKRQRTNVESELVTQ